MKALKTYGIHGLLEWHGTIHSNGMTMQLDFTNGSTTAYGIAPASYSTKNELTQHIIENSDEFKSGRIRLIRSIVLAEDKKPAANSKDGKTAKDYKEVTKTQEAKDILQKEYGYNVENIRSKAQAHEAAKAVGISFPNLQ